MLVLMLWSLVCRFTIEESFFREIFDKFITKLKKEREERKHREDKSLSYTVFQPQALELCARKVAAASGDMRKALGICRGAIEMLESELRESTCTSNLTSMVRVDHMSMALSRAYKSPIVDTVQSLPQHQQIILCSAVKLFRKGKKDTTIGEIPPVGIMELSCMCRVLGDQGILKLGQSRDDKLRRVTLQVDEADIMFALQGIRFFRSCLQ